jgi:hypothetical protein
MTVPPEAITAALADANANDWQRITRKTVTSMLEAAAPLIAAAERDRIIGYLCHGNDGEGGEVTP